MYKRQQAAFLLFVFFLIPAHAGLYKIDESHTEIGFSIKHLMISTVKGRFNKFSGQFDFEVQSGQLKGLKTTIDASSIDTNEPKRDKHLRSEDFFNVDKFKTLEFIGTDVSYQEKKPVEVKGRLTMHGITRPVTLKVEFKGEITDPWGNQRLAFGAQTKVNRQDFELEWNKKLDRGGVMIGDDVNIVIEGEAVLQKATSNK